MRRTRILVVGAVLLATSACGARWSDAQRLAVQARHQGGSSRPTAAAATGATGSTIPGATAGAGAAGGGGTGAATGTGAQTGGESATASGAGAGPLPCAAASDGPGVTADKINLGSISSLSGPVPGLGASSAAATRAYIAFRNATGGVCGRQLALREADDGTDAGTYRASITGMAPTVLGIAGGFAFGDVGGTDIIEQQNIPVVNLASADAVQRLPSTFDVNPPFERPDTLIGKYRYLYEQGARNVSMTYIAVDQSRQLAQEQRGLIEAAGLKVVNVQELPLSTLSYDSAARGVANSGADYLFFVGQTEANASMARSMADTGYKLKFAEYFTFSYGTAFIAEAGAAAEGAITWLRSLPNEEAGTNAELASYLQWMGQVAPGVPVDAFSVDSWVAAKAFVDSLEALPGPISREALIAQLRATDTYDADGMYGAIRLGAELTNGCEVAMQVQSGVWKRLAPAQGFLCQ